MIRRYYAYSAVTHAEKQRFCCGIVSIKSWFPKPVKAFQAATDAVMSSSGHSKDQIKIEYFARV